ncbi:MAG TPA: pyridoxal 5'-phosphate synthase glutaminase subunit PdxT [bacterium]|nr:pyridoxal 5'-phosphate synthase glutaminase subunit PdxT [bacterium]
MKRPPSVTGASPRIGLLSLQGAFIEHVGILRLLGAEVTEVRLPAQLAPLDGLIIPGGESTTMGKLAETFELLEPLRVFSRSRPTWGICAGMIALAAEIRGERPLLGTLGISVVRNAFGRQVDSFEIDLDIPVLPGEPRPFPAVFIRAPKFEAAEQKNLVILARLPDGSPAAVRQEHLLATSFHPELTDDLRFHQYFLDMVAEHRAGS